MGRLDKPFHFLGVTFDVARTHQSKFQPRTTTDIHSRCCRRALDKAIALRDSAAHPAEIKRYLIRWASWWHHVIGKNRFHFIGRWIDYTAQEGAGFELISLSLLLTHNRFLPLELRRSNGYLIQAAG